MDTSTVSWTAVILGWPTGLLLTASYSTVVGLILRWIVNGHAHWKMKGVPSPYVTSWEWECVVLLLHIYIVLENDKSVLFLTGWDKLFAWQMQMSWIVYPPAALLHLSQIWWMRMSDTFPDLKNVSALYRHSCLKCICSASFLEALLSTMYGVFWVVWKASG